MMTVLRPQFLLVLCLALLLSHIPVSVAQESVADTRVPQLPPAKDVRIVVDISGSMKDSDPSNLRQPAVRLLARMLPDDARSGVWTFGQYVNMLVPSGEVSPKWRDMAVKRSDRINSVALRTNIGEALEVASDDFYGDRRFDNTHFILLTDGVVDVSKDAAVNARERNRILDRVVERIRSRGATIHTIALSENADLALLERLAVDTGGTFSVAPDADSLNRVFAETLNTAAPQPEVPIKDNRFQVSDDVKEFTALIFHDDGGSQLALMTPDRKRMTKDALPDNVRWYAEGEYDLITVTKPASGEWQIDGKLGEQSRVTVVSDLRMAVSPLPGFFYTGQPVAVDAAFYEKDKRITNPDFLGVLNVSLTLATDDGRSGTKPLSGETPPADGVYSDTIEKLSDPGTYTLTLSADGKTFARQFSARITLRPPVSVTVEGDGQGDQASYSIEVRPEHPDLDRDASMVGVKVNKPGQNGESGFESLPFDASAGVWHKSITASAGDGNYQVKVRFQGQTENGRALNYSPGEFTAVFPRPADDQAAYTSLSAETVTDAGDNTPSSPESSEPLLPAEPEPESTPVNQAPAPEEAEEQQIAPPIDTSQVEEPVEPQPEAEPAISEEAPKPEPEPAVEGPSFLSTIPVWAWGTGLGLIALAVIGFAIAQARRKDGSSDTEAGEHAPVVAPEPEKSSAAETDIDSESAENTEEADEIPQLDESASPEPEPEIKTEPEPEGELPEAEPAEPAETPVPPVVDAPVEEEEPEPPVATEEADSSESDDVLLDDNSVPTLDEAEPADDVPEPAKDEGWPDMDEFSGDEPSEADETAEEIERFLEEARRDEADLQATDDDILTDSTEETEESADDDMLEDFDLSDIEDLPDLEDDPDIKDKDKDPDDRKSD